MRRNMKKPNPDLHSDAWWMRAIEGALSEDEDRLWQAHLAQCETCRIQWEAIIQVHTLLSAAPPPPPLSSDFTSKTTAQILQKQRLRRLLNFLGSVIIFAMVSWMVLSFLSTTYVSIAQWASFMIAGRQALFSSFLRTAMSLFMSWKSIFPYALTLAGLAILLLMPNGIVATLLIFWVSRSAPVAIRVNAEG